MFRSCCRSLLPDDWKGGFAMLVVVFVLSSFLDNIAAAMIGGTMATALFRGRVHVGFLAAIVAASNAGGSGSVVGDTTTTMMWIDGVQPLAGVRGLHRGGPGAALLRRRRGAPAARLPADREGRAGRRARRHGRASASSPRCSPRRSSPTSGAISSRPAGSTSCPAIGLAVWVALLLSRAAVRARLERAAVGDARRRLPDQPRAGGVDDADRGAAGGVVAGRARASASSRRCSTTSR